MAIYNGKHCVFEMVGVENTEVLWNSLDNVDNDNCSNNYEISNIRTTTLVSKVLALSNELQDNLSNTTIQTAKNGDGNSLISTSDKLFLLAEKEMRISPSQSNSIEYNALTTLDYYINHTTNADRKKSNSGGYRIYWLRSPVRGNTRQVVCVGDNGGFGIYSSASLSIANSPCFAF